MNIKQASKMLGVSNVHLCRCIASGRLNAVKVKGKWQISPSDLKKFTKANLSKSILDLGRNFSRKKIVEQVA